uniref:Uncharacterized protein n=1 Tax=Lepeophtheirus salmonis TaxID=72036 RepID=A0A0K2V1C6_LEPSM
MTNFIHIINVIQNRNKFNNAQNYDFSFVSSWAFDGVFLLFTQARKISIPFLLHSS